MSVPNRTAIDELQDLASGDEFDGLWSAGPKKTKKTKKTKKPRKRKEYVYARPQVGEQKEPDWLCGGKSDAIIRQELVAQDKEFCAALRWAVERGLERAPLPPVEVIDARKASS